MALGFTTSNAFGSLAVLPDRGFTREATQSVQTISFGDGYEQRVAVGINSTKETSQLYDTLVLNNLASIKILHKRCSEFLNLI